MHDKNTAILQKQPHFEVRAKRMKDQALCYSGVFDRFDGVDEGSGYLLTPADSLIEGQFIVVNEEAKTADFVTVSPMAASQVAIGSSYPYIDSYWADQIQVILDKTRKWRRTKFQAEDAVEFEDQGTILWGRQKDHPEVLVQKGIRIIPGGWEHEHCRICMATICEDEGFEQYGFVDDHDCWVCEACYRRYVEPRCIDLSD